MILYINIDNANMIKPSKDITVLSYNLMTKFYFYIGEKIAKKYATQVNVIKLLADYKQENGESMFVNYWEEVKLMLFEKKIQGIYTLVLPSEYLNWLKYHNEDIYREIYNIYYNGKQSDELIIDLEELYNDIIPPLCKRISRYLDYNAEKGFTHFVFSDETITQQSHISQWIIKEKQIQWFIISENFDKELNTYYKRRVDIQFEECTLTMIHIPGNSEIPGFYISEIPITIQQYKGLLKNKDIEGQDWIDYYEEMYARKYEDFTIASAVTVEHMLLFLNGIIHSISYKLPTREQWLYLVDNYYERVKWCVDYNFLGVSYKAIAWEMTSTNSYDIYCLLGVEYNKERERIIKGNNFRKSQQRDNIAFRLVCSELDIITYINKLDNADR